MAYKLRQKRYKLPFALKSKVVAFGQNKQVRRKFNKTGKELKISIF